MSYFKLTTITLLLILLSVPSESGFVLDKLRSLANGFCNLFNKETNEKTPLISENIKLQRTSTTPYDIDVRFSENGFGLGYHRTNGDVPKHELTRRLLAYNPLSPSGRQMIHTGDC